MLDHPSPCQEVLSRLSIMFGMASTHPTTIWAPYINCVFFVTRLFYNHKGASALFTFFSRQNPIPIRNIFRSHISLLHDIRNSYIYMLELLHPSEWWCRLYAFHQNHILGISHLHSPCFRTNDCLLYNYIKPPTNQPATRDMQ